MAIPRLDGDTPRACYCVHVPRHLISNGSALTVDAVTARRLLLHAQGLMDDSTQAADERSVLDLIERLGFIQIDSINTVERAHHLTLLARCDHYQPRQLAHLLERSRDLFEHWTHDASMIPTQWFPHWRHRFDRYRRRDPRNAWWKGRLGSRPRKIINETLKRIETDGPLMSKDFERPKGRGPEVDDKWWQWKPHKAALEHLWRCGDISVAGRVNFHKVYDLTERVLPKHHHLPCSERDEHVDWACAGALERLVIATPTEIAAFWRAVDIVSTRRWCEATLKRGQVVEVIIESSDGHKPRRAIAPADWRDRVKALPEPESSRIRLLSPFDPVVRDRQRALRLFNFDYRFEAFTPAPKRKYGYYVLPMLQGDEFVGRIEPVANREADELLIRNVWWEPDVKVTKARRAALDDAVERLAKFIGATRIAMNGRRG